MERKSGDYYITHNIQPKEVVVLLRVVTISATHCRTGNRYCGKFFVLLDKEETSCDASEFSNPEHKMKMAAIATIKKNYDFAGMRDISVDCVEEPKEKAVSIGNMTQI